MPARRNRSNGRFTKSTRRRRTPKKVNLANGLQTYLIANALTKGVFGTTAFNFATEGWLREKSPATQYGSGNSWSLNAQELLQSIAGNDSHMSSQWQGMGGISAAVKKNLTDNGMMMAVSLIGIPIAFKYGRKLLAKPIIRPANRMLATAGVKI